MKRTLFKKEYLGMGFVEALLALTIAGIVGIVLMGISAEAIGELRRLDIQDAIAQNAISTSIHIQDLAIKEAINNPEGNIFLNDLLNQTCYEFYSDTGEIKTPGTPIMAISRSQYMNDSLMESGSEYFRLMCVEHKSGTDNRRMVVKIIVGSNRVEGKATTKTDVKDYEYFSVINL